jgi:hypothetical protein
MNLLGAYCIAIYGVFRMRLEQLGPVCYLGSFCRRIAWQPLASERITKKKVFLIAKNKTWN